MICGDHVHAHVMPEHICLDDRFSDRGGLGLSSTWSRVQERPGLVVRHRDAWESVMHHARLTNERLNSVL